MIQEALPTPSQLVALPVCKWQLRFLFYNAVPKILNQLKSFGSAKFEKF